MPAPTPAPSRALEELELKLGYGFERPDLLERALTHRSFASVHNERLEFLGDAVLDTVIAKYLFDRFPDCQEGLLTEMRASLVRESSLAALARGLELGRFLKLGGGELHNGGNRRDSLLADAFESVLGAVFVDSGENYAAVREIVLRLFAERLSQVRPGEEQKDHKSQLQEWLQQRHRDLPVYRLAQTVGKDNAPMFRVSLSIKGVPPQSAWGSSKREAEQAVAGKVLALLQDSPARNAKSRLQEWLQQRHLDLPCYQVEQEGGPDREFVVTVSVSGLPSQTGRGPTRRQAEQEAAGAALALLEKQETAEAGGE